MANPWRQTEREVYQALKSLSAASSHKLGAHLNLSHKWIEDKLRILRDAGKIYISDYERRASTGPQRNVYSIKVTGDEKDEYKPRAKTSVQKTQDYRTKLKALREAKENVNVWK